MRELAGFCAGLADLTSCLKLLSRVDLRSFSHVI